MLTMMQNLLKTIADLPELNYGAYNLRANGKGVQQHSTDNISITSKIGIPGIDIKVKPGAKGEVAYIPVVVTESGVNDMVYNDFEIGENADVTIIAGCGIHNDGCNASQHDGIHRFHLCPGARLKYVEKHYGEGEGHQITYVLAGERGTVTVPNPTAQLAVGTLQNFLDQYLEANGGKVDYIHGEDVVEQLASQPDSIGFLLPAMGKDQLFPTVIFDGALPRKTFSMGEAHDKRFYLEARKIK